LAGSGSGQFWLEPFLAGSGSYRFRLPVPGLVLVFPANQIHQKGDQKTWEAKNIKNEIKTYQE